MAEAARHHDAVSEALAGLALPRRVRELLDSMGVDGLLALCQCWGGVRLYVPRDVDASHEIARVCGVDAARALCARYAGETLDVPMLSGLHRALRDAAIRAAWSSASARELARRFGITERTVFRVLADGDDAQMDMFD